MINTYRAKRFLPKIIILFAGLLIVFSLLFFKKSGLLTIQKIEVRTDFQFENQKKIESLFKPYLGQSFFFNNTDKLAEEIKNQEIKTAQIEIKKEFPGKIILEIKRRQPLVVISRDNLYFWVDWEGVVFSLEADAYNLPLLEISLQNLKIGSRIEMGKTKIPQILTALKQEEIRKIIVLDDQIQLATSQGCLILLPMEAGDNKIEALQIILNRFKIEGKRLTKIDLRFAKPVISF